MWYTRVLINTRVPYACEDPGIVPTWWYTSALAFEQLKTKTTCLCWWVCLCSLPFQFKTTFKLPTHGVSGFELCYIILWKHAWRHFYVALCWLNSCIVQEFISIYHSYSFISRSIIVCEPFDVFRRPTILSDFQNPVKQMRLGRATCVLRVSFILFCSFI